MLFSYNLLKDYVKGSFPEPEELRSLLNMHFSEVEGLEKKGGFQTIDIDILPNRAPDCLSHIGVAREIAAITKNKLTIPKTKIKEGNKTTKDLVDIEVEDKEDTPRYVGKVISDVEIGPSPDWLQSHLITCGLEPKNNVVDIMNFVMLETGQPLHAFDLDKIKGKVSVRKAKPKEKIETLDLKTYDLDKEILTIADKEGPIAIAGIKGGKRTGVDPGTKNILIEAANFNQKAIRNASRKLKLKTDASWRFENSIDPNLVDYAIKRASFLIQKETGGTPAKGEIDFYPKKVSPHKISLRIKYVSELLGVDISEKEIIQILGRLGFKAGKEKGKLLVEAPTRRLDVSIEEDLIEEVGRIYGFENIPSTFPKISLVPPKRNDNIFWENKCKNILKERGLTEIYNYSFIGENETEAFEFKKEILVELENPMSSENKYLRPSLILNLLKNIKENSNSFKDIAVFEIGRIFKKEKDRVNEKRMLAGALLRTSTKEEDFYELKGMVDFLLNSLGVSDIWYDDYKATPEDSNISIWHPGKIAEIKSGDEEIGFLGEISPKILHKMGTEERVAMFDFDFEKLLRVVSEEHEYQPLSPYPEVVRDIAVLVPRDTKVVELLNRINSVGENLIRDVDLFDTYEGEGIPEGRKNLAFHIIYQSEEKTLTSKEVDKIHGEIIKILEEVPEWEVRK